MEVPLYSDLDITIVCIPQNLYPRISTINIHVHGNYIHEIVLTVITKL